MYGYGQQVRKRTCTHTYNHGDMYSSCDVSAGPPLTLLLVSFVFLLVPTDFSTPPPVPSATLWTKDSPPVFWSGEEHLGYNHRSFQHLFPLKKASWLSRDVSVPADPHAVSQGEFGHYGGSYMTAQVFRGDCFHNFFQLRYLYS